MVLRPLDAWLVHLRGDCPGKWHIARDTFLGSVRALPSRYDCGSRLPQAWLSGHVSRDLLIGQGV